MKINIRQKLLFLSFIILVGMGFIGYGVYKSYQKLVDSAQWVERTEQVIYQSGHILSLAIDMETAARGFVIANDSAFLEPLFIAEKKSFDYIRQLKQITLDNPEQQQRVDSVNFYMNRRLEFSLKTVELRTKQGLAPAIAYTSTKEGKGYTDHLRQLTNSIQDEEDSLLKIRKQTNGRSAAAFNRVSIIIFILMMVFIILLLIAIGNYLFQNKEKEKRAAELIIANKELAFQNDEKEKRAAEQIIANKELAFQNKEKEKRAAELVIANTELVFQHKEKEQRAAELIIANKELAFQNDEKEKRAGELTVANQELKKAEDDIRILNEGLEQKVVKRTAELVAVNKELESFSYSVSHDLRAPLRAVHGYARMLKEDYGTQLDAEGGRVMNNIIANSKKMGQLIDDLLAFSRLGRKELVKINIPMQEMVETLCIDIKKENGNESRNIQFLVNRLQPARGDAFAIKQVWVNLISNAVKYSKLTEKTIIEIGSEIKGNEIIYYIKDNGAGFDMRYADKLFGVFQRLHTDEKFEGTGVGLAIVHRIISKHGGRVWAEGKVNEGAVFCFSLPDNTSS
jgi:signal transduction histidine kinase